MQSWRSQLEPPVVLLLSGGGDSVALFCLLVQAKIPFSCLHFVHGDSDFQVQALDFCQKLCQSFSVPLSVERLEVVCASGQSWEAEARSLRYRWVDALSGTVLTAHTADDQAETVVMRLLDGSGLAGLAGIRRRRGVVVRPLLDVTRKDLRNYLESLGQGWLEDPTNLDGNDRARLRAKVMPFLQEFRPGLVRALGRTAAELALDEDGLREQAEAFLSSQTLERDHWLLGQLQALPSAVRHRFLRALWNKVADDQRPLGGVFRDAERLIVSGGDDRGVPFGSVCLRRLGCHLWLQPLLAPDYPETPAEDAVGRPLEETGWTIVSEVESNSPPGVNLALPGKVLESGTAYTVRARRPGDRFRGKELKKLLAALGHPPWVRDRWPLLTHQGEIVDVPGLGPAAVPGQAGLVFDPWRYRFGFER